MQETSSSLPKECFQWSPAPHSGKSGSDFMPINNNTPKAHSLMDSFSFTGESHPRSAHCYLYKLILLPANCCLPMEQSFLLTTAQSDLHACKFPRHPMLSTREEESAVAPRVEAFHLWHTFRKLQWLRWLRRSTDAVEFGFPRASFTHWLIHIY